MNVLAPCYNKVNGLCYESELQVEYMNRHRFICTKLLETGADIICLQEFWSSSPSLRNLYITELCKPESGGMLPITNDTVADLACIQQDICGTKYTMRELHRTSHWRTRDDSIVTFVKNERIVIQDAKNILFHDAGDRVALLLLLGLRPDSSNGDSEQWPLQQFICVNTHLLFPHNEYSTKIRMREITKILGFVESYKQNDLCKSTCKRSDVRLPVIITGDFNGGPRGSVYKYVKSQNYRSAIEEAFADRTHEGPERRWVTHKSHLGKNVAVDHIFYLNPSDQIAERLPPLPDWTNLVFREVMQRLVEKFGGAASMRDIFSSFDRDCTETITAKEFEEALKTLGFDGEGSPALTKEELDVLLQSADVDKNGMIDYQEFCDRFWIAANRETERLMAISSDILDSEEPPAASSSRITSDDAAEEKEKQWQIYSDRFSFARSKWLTKADPSQLSEAASLGRRATATAVLDAGNAGKSKVIEILIDDDSDGDEVEVAEAVEVEDPSLALFMEEGGEEWARELSAAEAAITSDGERRRAVGGSYDVRKDVESQPLGDLRVRAAALWPAELEQGLWPADYSASDHGLVECIFEAVLTPKPTAQEKP